MIRALALMIGVALGLAGAGVVGLRGAHLRLALVDLPGWIDDAAGVRAGHGALAAGQLRWVLLGVFGPRWAVTLHGSDWQAEAAATLGGAGWQISGVSGVLPAVVFAPGAEGTLGLDGGRLRLTWAGQVQAGWVTGQARGLVLDGQRAEGAVRLELTGGNWRIAR